ncbi:MAG: class F sortase [Candidatus Parcubacteria bacterium]|nr:class F sortase [Candidatus Parcubacteria bacterium]
MKSKKVNSYKSRSKIAQKQAKLSARRTRLLVFTAGIFLSVALVLFIIPQKPIQSRSVSDSETKIVAVEQKIIKSKELPAGKPIRLSIPKIRVDAAIESVGLVKGAVGVPKVPSAAAWYNLGAKPGNIGSAIITGHYGPWIDGRRSVFDNLYKLKKGDKIYIKDDKGKIITFVVRELKSYDRNAIVAGIFISTDGKSHLNLITCDGLWNRLIRQYSKRLVVFADKE